MGLRFLSIKITTISIPRPKLTFNIINLLHFWVTVGGWMGAGRGCSGEWCWGRGVGGRCALCRGSGRGYWERVCRRIIFSSLPPPRALAWFHRTPATAHYLQQPRRWGLPAIQYKVNSGCPVLYILHTLYMIIIIMCNVYNI